MEVQMEVEMEVEMEEETGGRRRWRRRQRGERRGEVERAEERARGSKSMVEGKVVCAVVTVFAITSLCSAFLLFFCSSALLLTLEGRHGGAPDRWLHGSLSARDVGNCWDQRVGPFPCYSVGSRHRYRCPPSRARRSQSMLRFGGVRLAEDALLVRLTPLLCSAYPNTQTVPPQPLPVSAASGKCSCFFEPGVEGQAN